MGNPLVKSDLGYMRGKRLQMQWQMVYTIVYTMQVGARGRHVCTSARPKLYGADLARIN